MADVPHLAFPLRLTPAGTFAVVEQDTLQDVEQCVHVILRTERGSRPLSPEVGIDDPTFTAGVDAELLTSQLEELEPRAQITVEVEPNTTGEQNVRVHVELSEPEAED